VTDWLNIAAVGAGCVVALAIVLGHPSPDQILQGGAFLTLCAAVVNRRGVQ
jgi:hypothetical protein